MNRLLFVLCGSVLLSTAYATPSVPLYCRRIKINCEFRRTHSCCKEYQQTTTTTTTTTIATAVSDVSDSEDVGVEGGVEDVGVEGGGEDHGDRPEATQQIRDAESDDFFESSSSQIDEVIIDPELNSVISTTAKPTKFAPKFCLVLKFNCKLRSQHPCCKYPLPTPPGSVETTTPQIDLHSVRKQAAPKTPIVSKPPALPFSRPTRRPGLLSAARLPVSAPANTPDEDTNAQEDKDEEEGKETPKDVEKAARPGVSSILSRRPTTTTTSRPTSKNKYNIFRRPARPNFNPSRPSFLDALRNRPGVCEKLKINCKIVPYHKCCKKTSVAKESDEKEKKDEVFENNSTTKTIVNKEEEDKEVEESTETKIKKEKVENIAVSPQAATEQSSEQDDDEVDIAVDVNTEKKEDKENSEMTSTSANPDTSGPEFKAEEPKDDMSGEEEFEEKDFEEKELEEEEFEEEEFEEEGFEAIVSKVSSVSSTETRVVQATSPRRPVKQKNSDEISHQHNLEDASSQDKTNLEENKNSYENLTETKLEDKCDDSFKDKVPETPLANAFETVSSEATGDTISSVTPIREPSNKISQALPVIQEPSNTINQALPVFKEPSNTINQALPMLQEPPTKNSQALPVLQKSSNTINPALPVFQEPSNTINQAVPLFQEPSNTINQAVPLVQDTASIDQSSPEKVKEQTEFIPVNELVQVDEMNNSPPTGPVQYEYYYAETEDGEPIYYYEYEYETPDSQSLNSAEGLTASHSKSGTDTVLDANQISPRVQGECFRFDCLNYPDHFCCVRKNTKKRQISISEYPKLSLIDLTRIPANKDYPGRVTASVTRVEKSIHWGVV